MVGPITPENAQEIQKWAGESLIVRNNDDFLLAFKPVVYPGDSLVKVILPDGTERFILEEAASID